MLSSVELSVIGAVAAALFAAAVLVTALWKIR